MVKIMRPVIGAVIFNVLTTQAMAEETRFFSSGIDYWQAKEVPDQTKKNVSPEETPIQEKTKDQEVKQAPFDWQKFSSPKNNEFFKEGDYLPPEPFMEVSRNPSDENIRQWFAYIEQKNNLTERLTRRIDEYVKKNPPQRQVLKSRLSHYRLNHHPMCVGSGFASILVLPVLTVRRCL